MEGPDGDAECVGAGLLVRGDEEAFWRHRGFDEVARFGGGAGANGEALIAMPVNDRTLK